MFFRGKGEEKEEHTTKLAKKTEVKHMRESKMKRGDNQEKEMETRGRENRSTSEGHGQRAGEKEEEVDRPLH